MADDRGADAETSDRDASAAWAERSDGDGADAADDGENDDAGGNVAGEFSPTGPIEPGTVEPENAAFVALGAYLAVLLVAKLILGLDGFTLREFALVTGVVAFLAVAFGGFFGVVNPDT